MRRRKFRTVELFCGIGGFRIAAEKHHWTTIWANDSDSSACKVYRDKFGNNTLHEGDIWENLSNIPDHDVLTAGFPCQPFSSAGKKQGLRDPRGNLFEAIIKVLKLRHPPFFVLENVRRLLTMEQGAHFATIIKALTEIGYDVEWRILNASHFGLSQNRERVVLLGVAHKHDATLESNGLKTRLINKSDLKKQLQCDIGRFLDRRRWRSIGLHAKRFESWGLAIEGKFVDAKPGGFSNAVPRPTLRTVLEETVPPIYDFTESTLSRLNRNVPVNRFINGVEIISNQGGGARMGYTIFGTAGVAPTLTSSSSRHYERYKVNGNYRRLTPNEYARLQGFPDNHCAVISSYNQYSLYGNAVPPPMIDWVFEQIMSTNPQTLKAPNEYQQDLRL